MRGMKWAPVMGAAMMLAACGGEKPAPAQEEAADALKAGLYEVTSEVTALASTDNTTPFTKLKVGDKATVMPQIDKMNLNLGAPELRDASGAILK